MQASKRTSSSSGASPRPWDQERSAHLASWPAQPRSHEGQRPTWAMLGTVEKAATSSQLSGSQAPSQREPHGAENVLERALGMNDEPQFDSE